MDLEKSRNILTFSLLTPLAAMCCRKAEKTRWNSPLMTDVFSVFQSRARRERSGAARSGYPVLGVVSEPNSKETQANEQNKKFNHGISLTF